ncbi:MAG: NAD(P)-dependent oxidoreductase [Geitlerinemataceae cyanobacterium]
MVNIGILGTGLMGQPMAQRLLESGFSVTAYNRTPSKLEPLQSAGVHIVATPREVLEASDCIILMLTDAAAIRSLLLCEDTRSRLRDRTIIQMGTITPTQSQAIRDEIVAAGGEYLEATVLGSIPEAKSGTLIVMVGSTPEQFDRWLEVLKSFGSEPLRMGEVGSSAAVKLAMNQLIGSLTSAFALSLAFVRRQGLDVEDFMKIVRQSALYAPTFDKKLQRMLENNYANPNFPVKHLHKDANLFLEEAQTLGLETSLVEGVSQVLQRTLDLGLADEDYSALYQAIENENK